MNMFLDPVSVFWNFSKYIFKNKLLISSQPHTFTVQSCLLRCSIVPCIVPVYQCPKGLLFGQIIYLTNMNIELIVNQSVINCFYLKLNNYTVFLYFQSDMIYRRVFTLFLQWHFLMKFMVFMVNILLRDLIEKFAKIQH